MEEFDWLSRIISRAGALPRLEAEAAIRAGRVTVSGRRVRQPFALVRPQDAVRLDGTIVPTSPKTLVLAFHKPPGVVTSKVDQHGQGTVFERLLKVLPRELLRFEWHAAGRLDRGTRGLLLFTNDERMVGHLTSPTAHLPKRYRAMVSGTLTTDRLRPLERGMTLGDVRLRPAQVHILSAHQLEITLTEGKNHQVKRMLGAVGYPVLDLERVAIGGLTLDFPEGTYRMLRDDEIREALGYESERGARLPSNGPSTT